MGEKISGKPNYPALAEIAAQRLAKDRYGFWSAVKGVEHKNPVTEEPCEGDLVISFRSWSAALKSGAMREVGSVSGTCSTCGGGGFINRSKELVDLSKVR